MPIELPTWDPARGALVPTTYFDATEVAERLHVSVRTVTRYTTERQLWPHVRLAGRAFLTEEMIGRVVEMSTYNPDELGPPPRRLGVVEDAVEDVR